MEKEDKENVLPEIKPIAKRPREQHIMTPKRKAALRKARDQARKNRIARNNEKIEKTKAKTAKARNVLPPVRKLLDPGRKLPTPIGKTLPGKPTPIGRTLPGKPTPIGRTLPGEPTPIGRTLPGEPKPIGKTLPGFGTIHRLPREKTQVNEALGNSYSTKHSGTVRTPPVSKNRPRSRSGLPVSGMFGRL